MKTNSLSIGLLISGLTLSLVACSAKVSGGSGDMPAVPGGFDQTKPTVPPAAPTPSVPDVTTIARDYSHAAYAFCSTQGVGILLDFQGARLDVDGSGTARIGSKICGDTAAIRFQQRQVSFTVSMSSGKPQLAFVGTDYNDHISPYSYQSGLAAGRAASTVIGGNSGECYFLENASFNGLPFGFSCE